MFGLRSRADRWEELYDAENNTYFYRNRATGEFSRTNPDMEKQEVHSEHVPKKDVVPLWETTFDPESGEPCWVDLETGYTSLTRPERGTFVSEVPLREFRARRPITKTTSSMSDKRKSTVSAQSDKRKSKAVSRKSMRVRDADFAIVTADEGEVDLVALTGKPPEAHDAAATYLNPPKVNYRRLSTRDGGEIPEFPELDETAVFEASTIATDNPLFNPTGR